MTIRPRGTIARRRMAALAVALLAVGTSACTSGSAPRHASGSASSAGPATATGAPIAVTGTRTVTGNERSFGASLGTIPGAVYQPDVVLIGGGANAIVGALDNGLVWTVRGDAPGAGSLAVGRIMAATSLATGRVVAVKRVDGDVQVTLAPVTLTDVFRTLHVASSAPIALGSPLAYSYANSPRTSTAGQTGTDAAPPSTTPSPAPAPPPPLRFAAGLPAPPPPPSLPSGLPSVELPQPTISPKAVHEGKFDLLPYCCYPSQGVHISYNEGAGRMAATVGIVMGSKPLVDFHIDIDFGGLQEAVFEINGPKAIEFAFSAATKDVSGNYRSPTFEIPFQFTFPIASIPFTVTLNQSVHASIQLAGQAAFSTKGEYVITGGLGFAYRHGGFGVSKPSFSSRISSLENATSLSVGINALSIGYGAHFAIGIGVIGFNGGPWFDLDATLAISKDGSPPQTSLTAGCAVADVDVQGRFGVGYTIPEVVAKAVNAFLTLFRAKPIKAKGGPHWGPFTIWNPGLGKRCLQRTG